MSVPIALNKKEKNRKITFTPCVLGKLDSLLADDFHDYDIFYVLGLLIPECFSL